MKPLTPRQTEVMNFICMGFTGPEIAQRLWISPKTVRTYRAAILDRLGAKNMPHAVAMYLMNATLEMSA